MNVYGDNLVTNGDFAAADGWTASGGWSLPAGRADWETQAGTLSQELAITTGRTYRVSLTLSDLEAGVDDLTVRLGGTSVSHVWENGVNTTTVVAGSSDLLLELEASLDATAEEGSFSVDDVSVELVEDVSVIEAVARNVLDTVEGVTEAAGYEVTIRPRRPTRIDWDDDNPMDKRAIVVMEDDRQAEEPVLNCRDRVATFAIYVVSTPSESDTTAAETHANRLSASITKAMLTDWTRGGLAQDTWETSEDRSQARDEEWPGVILKFDVHYRTAWGDPYTRN